MMRRYSEAALSALAESRDTVKTGAVSVLLKKTDLTKKGHMDPYEARYENPEPAVAQTKAPVTPQEIAADMRNRFGCHNYNLNRREIYTEYEFLTVEGRRVGLWRYYLRRRAESPRPCLFYIHGGGWVAGSVYTVENPCKLIAELADAVVFNIDYSLAPEAKYPAAVNELWEALRHIYQNADAYGIDREKILAAGDSAGGNFAAVLALKDREEGTHMIAAQFLLYPGVVLGNTAPEGYVCSKEDFDVSPEERDRVMPALNLGRRGGRDGELDEMTKLYVSDPAHAETPYVSPALAGDFQGLAPAVIATAEYDGLRVQGEFYGGQLAAAGVPVQVMRYAGCFHAFLDRLGYVPQSEDVCREMAKRLMMLQ